MLTGSRSQPVWTGSELQGCIDSPASPHPAACLYSPKCPFLLSFPNKTLIPAADRCHHVPPFTVPAPPSLPPRSTTFAVFVCDRSYASDAADRSYPASPNHHAQQILAPASHLSADNKEVILVASQGQDHTYRPSVAGSRQNSLSRAQQPHVPQPPETVLNGPRPQMVKDYGYAFQCTFPPCSRHGFAL